MSIYEIMALAFTLIFAENAVFVYALGIDELFYIGRAADNKKSAVLSSAVFILAAVATELLTYLSVTYLFGGLFVMAVVAAPIFALLSFEGIAFLVSKYIKKPQKSVGYMIFPLAVSTATVGIAVSNLNASISSHIIMTVFLSFGVIFSHIIFNDVRERCNIKKQPDSIRGIPSALIAIGLIAMVFSELSGVELSALFGNL